MRKITKLLLVATSFLIVGCNPAENFANKTIQQIGDGKYVSVTYNGYSSKALEILGQYNDVFDFTEIRNEEILENKTIDNEGAYFQTNFMFDSFKLIETTETTINLCGKNIDSKYVHKLSDKDEKAYTDTVISRMLWYGEMERVVRSPTSAPASPLALSSFPTAQARCGFRTTKTMS